MDSVLIQDIHMHIPDTDIYIYAGDICKVPNLGAGNFTAFYGWYTPKDSHPVYGWFFISETGEDVYPIRFLYFDGIEVVEHHDPSGGVGVMPYESGKFYSKGQLVYLTTGTIYQATQDFTASNVGPDVDDDLAADIAAGKLVQIGSITMDDLVTENSSNPVKSSGIYNFVNSSVATNTAYFIGTFNSVQELEAYSGDLSNNDYAFVIGTDAAGNTVYKRYKYNGDTEQWAFEYALNNSSFTANQWATINSGLTASDKTKLNNTLTGEILSETAYAQLQTKDKDVYFTYD